jgi:hypothetical protein
MKKSNYCTNLIFGGILNRYGHFKNTLQAQRCRNCGRWTVSVIRFLSHTAAMPFLKKKSLAFLLNLYLYFPTNSRIYFDTWIACFYQLRCIVPGTRSYFEGPGFDSLSGGQLYRLRCFVVFLSFSRLLLGYYLKFDHCQFLPCPSELLIFGNPTIRCCVLYVSDIVSLNKLRHINQ